MPARSSSTKIQLRGIFVGAKVVRGPDWEWGQQDGGDGKTGRVMEIRGWDNESCRSVANVSWVTGSTNVYRLGHKGNVDLKYLQSAAGGYYYRDHMPILGESGILFESKKKEDGGNTGILVANLFCEILLSFIYNTLQVKRRSNNRWWLHRDPPIP